MTSWLEYEAMNKRRSQIKYYVNNLTLTHYCQIHLSNSPSLPSPYYLPSLPHTCTSPSFILHSLFFPSLYPLLPLPYYISLYFLLSTPYFLLSSSYFLFSLVPPSLFILLPLLPPSLFILVAPSLILLPLLPPSLFILFSFLPCTPFSLHPSPSPSSFSLHPCTSSSLRSTYFPNFYPYFFSFFVTPFLCTSYLKLLPIR